MVEAPNMEILMPSIASFVRRTPGHILNDYFLKRGIPLAGRVDWSARSRAISRVNSILEEAGEPSRSKIQKETERVAPMTDEAGQVALFQVCANPELLEQLPNGHARALWMFEYEPEAFRHAEEVRYTDEHRRGRKWSGFVGEANLSVKVDREAVEAFKTGIKQHLESQNVHVDIFDRQRTSFKGEKTYQITQATVYRDGHSDDVPEFEGGALRWRTRRPVYEAAVTYEPATGVIEAVADNRDSREDLVRLFAEHLLGVGAAAQKLPFRQFDLDALLRPYDFPSDPEDGIESVRVTQLRLMPFDSVGERVTLECSRSSPDTIWEIAEDHFESNDPLKGGWLVTKAKLVISFHPDSGSRRGKTLPLTVTMPHGCDLKDRTERERMIGEKYLARWGLLKNV